MTAGVVQPLEVISNMKNNRIRSTYQWRQSHAWKESASTQVPTRSSPFLILTLAALHSGFWHPARPLLLASVRCC